MTNEQNISAEETKVNGKEYLDGIAAELLEDEEWEFPKENRFFLRDYAWTLLGL